MAKFRRAAVRSEEKQLLNGQKKLSWLRRLSMRPFAVIGALAVAGSLLSACASTNSSITNTNDYEDTYSIDDPFEAVNRKVFAFNQAVDRAILRPTAAVYSMIPQWGRDRVSNLLDNLGEPVNFANNFLQGEVDRAAQSFLRFSLNSTVGIGGLFDVAGGLGIEYVPEGFGQTMATWGADAGPYLMFPLLGPSNPRDAAGMVVDWFIDPFTTALKSNERLARSVARGIEQRAAHLDTLDALNETSVDFYAAMRELYRQHRDNEIRNGALPPPMPIPSITIENYDDGTGDEPDYAADEDQVASN
ncbi:MAG: MlaA family lipoprotein [Woeseiales bacterium]